MHRFGCGLLLCFALLSTYALAQENRIVRIGVATMKNSASLSVPGTVERDHLVAALNQLKPDKKLHIKVEGMPLDGITPEDVGAEAKDKKCDYVVYTTLVELRGSTDPAMPRPGTIETNPNGVWNNPRDRPWIRSIAPRWNTSCIALEITRRLPVRPSQPRRRCQRRRWFRRLWTASPCGCLLT